jgi:hypothetical protein
MRLSRFVLLAAVAGAIYCGTGKQSAAETAPDPHHPEHKWACTPTSLMWPNEAPARGVGAPVCKAGYAATEWYCLGDELIHPENRGVTEEGQPRCRAGFTASRQRHLQSEYSPIQVPKQLPPVMRNGVFVPQYQLYRKSKSKTSLVSISTNYFYEVGDYQTSTEGLSGTFLVGKPFIAPVNVNGVPYGHTLGQIAAISSQTVTSGGTTQTVMQTVELGWTVDGFENGAQKYTNNALEYTVPDLNPHLFVSRSINGNYQSPTPGPAGNYPTCYNATVGCDFTPIANSVIQAGGVLTEGSTVGLAISHRLAKGTYPAGWYLTVTTKDGSADIGYYEDTLWTAKKVNFVAANDVQWYGEVAL